MKNLIFKNILYIIFYGLDLYYFAMLDWNYDAKLIEWQEQENRLENGTIDAINFPNVADFFWKYESENKNDVTDILLKDSNLLNILENFLGNKNIKIFEKTKFKKDLKNCKSYDEIKWLIAEKSLNWYKITWKTSKEDFDSNDGDGFNEIDNVVNQNSGATETLDSDEENLKNKERSAISWLNENEAGYIWDNAIYLDNQADEIDDKAKIDEGKEEAYQKMLVAIAEREKLAGKYGWLEEKTNKDSEYYVELKQKFEVNWTLNQLRQQNYDDEFIDDYIVLQATLYELKNNRDNIYSQEDISTFDKLVKSLNNELKVKDTNVESFSLENVSKTRQELFNSDIWNEELIKEKNDNKSNHESEYEKLLTMDNKEAIHNYWKFITDSATKDIYERYEKEGKLLDDEYSKLKWMVEEIKLQMDEKTKDLVEQLCIISQIKWMSKCVWKKYADKFEFNKATEVKNNNWVIVIEWHVDGVDFYLRQDSKDSDARLQTSSSIFMEDNSYNIWSNFEDSPFILPTKDDVFNIAKQSISSWKALSGASTPAEYVKLLQKSIMDDMDWLYSDTDLAHHYMEDKINQEKIADNSIWLLEDLSNSKITWQVDDANKKLFDFVRLVDFNTRNSTIQEKKVLNNCITKIRELISEYWNSNKKPEEGKYPKILERYLTEEGILNDTKNQIDSGLSWWDTLFGLFDFYKNSFDWRQETDSYMIDFASLEKDLSWWGEFSMKAKQREDDNDDVDWKLYSQLDWI